MKKKLGLIATSLLAVGLVTSCGLFPKKQQEQVDEEGNVIVQMSIMNSVNENPGWLAMIDAANAGTLQ